MKRASLLGTSGLAAISSLFLITAAQAQEAAPASGGEVVVTARARSEKLLEVPISVQAFSAATLAANNITDLNTLQTSAGFTFNSQNASYAGGGRQLPNLVFRGLASNSGFFGSSGAVFVDGIAISGGLATVTLADVAQIDVLKGPQNVYFGKNTFGGAINLITSHPTEADHASFSVGYSNKGSYDDYLSVEGAIIPGLLTGKVTGELLHQGEQYKSGDGGALGEQDTKGITVVLYATPTPDAWVQTRFHYQHDDDSTPDDAYVDGPTYGTPCAGLVHNYFCNGVPSLSSLTPQKLFASTKLPPALLTAVNNNTLGGPWFNKVPSLDHAGLARDDIQGSVQGGFNLPYDTKLQYSAGYNGAASLDLTNADHTSTPYFFTAQPYISRDFEADARLVSSTTQRLRAVLGVNYFQSSTQLSQGGNFFGNYGATSQVDQYDKTYAVYGSLDFDILSNLTATGELRYQSEAVTGYSGATEAQHTYTHALPRVILTYKPTKTTNVYISYSEGVQPPQLQSGYITAVNLTAATGNTYYINDLAKYGANTAITQDPKLRVWEVGWKQSLFADKIFFSVDYYNQFWDDSLVNTFLFDPVGCEAKYGANGGNYAPNIHSDCPLGSSGGFVTGISNDHIQGIEFDGTARVTSKLTTHASFTWTDAIRTSYDDSTWGPAFTSGVVPVQNGKRVNEVPEYQASVDATYKDHLYGPYDWYAHGVVNYTSSVYTDANDIGYINGYARVNLSAGVTRGNLTFEAFVTNLLDDKNWDMAVRFPSSYQIFNEAYEGVIASAPNPRDFGIKVSGKF